MLDAADLSCMAQPRTNGHSLSHASGIMPEARILAAANGPDSVLNTKRQNHVQMFVNTW